MMGEKEKKNCVSMQGENRIAYCEDYSQCWSGGKLNPDNKCGYPVPEPMT